MASIIADLSDDIKKMKSLKEEIQQVKKELGSINVKVELDIKRDMEARLKALTGQYDALVKKVSEAEGKVIASTQRINQAAEKIIKAQEQMARAAGAQPQAASGGTSSTANQAQTASVQAQAKAYDELAQEIDEVIGTRAQNIRRIVEEQNAIKMLNAQISNVRKNHTNSNGIVDEKGVRLLEHYNNELEQHKIQLAQARQQLSNNIKLDVSAATSMNALSQSLGRMRMAYRELTEEERKSPFGQELLASIQQADAKIKQLDATIGNHQRNVGNYASGWNGLNMSIQQIGRELPSLAMGINTFFLAISNNLPILTDEIARARKEYNALKAAGQAATPVWKQVVSSLVSWQTALTVGITLLTLYGKDIIEWVGNLFKGEKQVDALAERMKALNDIQREAGLSAAKERSELDVLYKATQDHTRSLEDRNAAADELQRRYPKYFENLSNEAILAGNASTAYKQLTDNILKAAQARAAQDKITKNYERMFQLQRAINADTNWTNRHRESAKGGTATTPVSVVQNMGSLAVQQLTDEAIEYNRRIEALKKNHEELKRLSKDNDYYASLIDMESFTEDYALQVSKATEQAKSYLDELAKLREENEDREIDLMKEGTEKQLAEIELRYKREKEAIINQQRELAEANKEAGITSTNASGLTTEQQTEIDRALELLTKQRTQQVLGVYKEEFYAMRDNLEEYGNYQQQKLALAQEYAEKIAAAQTEGERRSLEQERDNRMSAIETQRLKSEIDWSVAFGEFGGMFADVIKPVLEQARQYMQTDEFKNANHDSQRTLIDAVQQMEESLGGASKVNFKKLASDIDAYRKSLVQLRNAQGQYDDAYKELSEAQQEYLEALENGTDAEKEAAKQAVDEAQSKVDAASVAVDGLTESSEKAKTAITDTATTLKTSMDGVVGGLQKLTSGSLRGAYDGLIELGKSAKNISGLGKVGDAMGTIAKGLENVPIVGWIASILDVLKDGLTDFIQTIHDSATSAVTNIFDDVFSGEMFKQGFNNTLESIEKTIGMFGIDFSFSGSNAKEVQETIDRLTDRNEALQSSIEALNETMKEARGSQSVQAAKQAEEYQKEVNQNYLEMAMAQAGYHGSHHSWNYYWGGFSQEQIDKLSEQIGREWSGSLWDLSPEEMQILKGNVDMWTQIQNTGEGGYGGRLTDKLDDYIEQAGKLDEITETLRESLTQISFDSMYDSFIDNLMNMEYSAEDAADNIAEYFMRAMLSNKIGEMYADQLEEWYKKFATAMEDGSLDNDEMNALRDEYLGYVEDALKLRDDLAAATGYDQTGKNEQQSASRGGYETMTQDQATELSGRFTALYESNLRLEQTGERTAGIADEVRSIIAQSYIELQQINENTGAIVKPIQQMQRDIEEVKRNTSRI